METADNVINQGIGSYVAYLNQLRLEQLSEMLATIIGKEASALNDADKRFLEAIAYVDQLKAFLGSPEHILGSASTKHGEIAERMQVYINNAWDVLKGHLPEARIDDVPRTGPVDYFVGDQAVQSKFYNGLRETLSACREHYTAYANNPDFNLQHGDFYHIPKDQYQYLQEIMSKKPSELSRSEFNVSEMVRNIERETRHKYTDIIQQGRNTYAEVQQGRAYDTLNHDEETLAKHSEDETKEIKKGAESEKAKAVHDSGPNLQEAGKAALIGAGISGVITFVIKVYQKRKTGKSISQFTTEDWKDIGIDTGKATLKGGISGGGIYLLSNFAKLPTPMAGAYMSAAFGIVRFSRKYRKGEIDSTEFIEGSEMIAIESALAAVGGALGQVIIPIPILGAMIGSVVAGTLVDISKKYLDAHEQQLVLVYAEKMKSYINEMDTESQKEIEKLLADFKKWSSLSELVFSVSDNEKQFEVSIALAKDIGVQGYLKSRQETDDYFMGNGELITC